MSTEFDERVMTVPLRDVLAESSGQRADKAMSIVREHLAQHFNVAEDDVRLDPSSVTACVAGASSIEEIEAMLRAAGFTDVAIAPKDESEEFIREWDGDRDASEYVVSANIEARKPE